MVQQAHILVVDDEDSVLMTIQAILQQEGYRVSAARTEREGRDLLGGEPFDVALVDLRLENADGVAFLETMSRHQPDCAAIVLTGYASLESAVSAIRQGAYDYLVKPCDLDELKLTVARAAERVSLTRALRARVEELNAANAQISSFAQQLQERVDQATAELNQKVRELAEAKHRLEEAHHQREEFISMIAHELSQPLTTLMGYAQLLGRPRLAPDVDERARNTLFAETRRLARLVEDLADASRLAAGHFRIQAAEVDLATIARTQAEFARATTQRHRVEVEVPAGPVSAVCDRDRVAQVISNLLSNAIKYTAGGEIRVRLEVEGGEAKFSVRDQGPGIPLERLEAIFEPYVRLAGDSSGQPKGTGLGLYIARGIIEAHGGSIRAESSERDGTTFTLRLPLAPSAGKAGRVSGRVEETIGR